MIIDGIAIAENIKQDLKEQVSSLKEKPSLAIIYVGENPASASFIARKKKFGEEIGVDVVVHKISDKISQEALKEEIKNIAEQDNSDGIVVQLPLPNHIDTDEILNAVPQEKDVDVLSIKSVNAYKADNTKTIPPVAGAIEEICTRNNLTLKNKNIVIVGNGRLVGQPVNMWLLRQGIEATVVDENTPNKTQYIENADVVISGVGIPHLIKAESLKDGVVIFDAGTSLMEGKLCGDFEPECSSKASLFTPVPGGIGPITVAVLFKNLLSLQTPPLGTPSTK